MIDGERIIDAWGRLDNAVWPAIKRRQLCESSLYWRLIKNADTSISRNPHPWRGVGPGIKAPTKNLPRPGALNNYPYWKPTPDRTARVLASRSEVPGVSYLLVCDSLARFKVGFTAAEGLKRPKSQMIEGAADCRLAAVVETTVNGDGVIRTLLDRWRVPHKQEWFYENPESLAVAHAYFKIGSVTYKRQSLIELPAKPHKTLSQRQIEEQLGTIERAELRGRLTEAASRVMARR